MSDTTQEQITKKKHSSQYYKSCEKTDKIKSLEQTINILKNLCNTINPYEKISDQQKKILAQFHITDFYDPFTITNKLLVLLEDSIEELQQLKNKEQISYE